MAIGISNTVLALTELCLFFTVVIDASQGKNCNCLGPTKYYEELGCTPVFKYPEDCCPIRYNCDVWTNVSYDKCFVNGHVYEPGDWLREEDKNPCDNCQCIGPGFYCVVGYCAEPNPNCYMKRTALQCCGIEVCGEKEEDRPTCIVDGKTYKDGEFFVPSANPEKHCYCGVGYTDENLEPFCVSPKRTWCSNLLYHAENIRNDCAPTYLLGESPQKDCNVNFECRFTQFNTARDIVIKRKNEGSEFDTSVPEDSDMLCHFGNLTLRVGDEFTDNSNYTSNIVKCVCEVPPVPTCQRTNRFFTFGDFWPSGLHRWLNDSRKF